MDRKQKKVIRMKINWLMDNPTDENVKEAQRLGQMLSPSQVLEKQKVYKRNERYRNVNLEVTAKNMPKRTYGGNLLIDPTEYINDRNKGITKREIAKKLNISVDLLELEIERAKRRGLIKEGDINRRFRDRKGLDKKKYLEYKKQGITDMVIIKKHNLCTSSITDLKKDWGLPTRQYQKALPKDTIIDYLKAGVKGSQIAKLEGLSRQNVYNTFKKYGIDKIKIKQIRLDHLRKLNKERGII